MIERTNRLSDLLSDAMVLAEEFRDSTVLRQLREVRNALDDVNRANIPIQIDIFATRVFSRGLPVALSRAEIAVVFALCLDERGVSREQLADMLYPDVDPLNALNAVKVNVHRVRRRIGDAAAIRFDNGRYALGNFVDPELPRLEIEVRRLMTRGIPDQTTRARMERIRRRSAEARPPFVLEWNWFNSLERRVQELGHDVGVLLARDALNKGHFERAIEIAAELSQQDPVDEGAAELAIRGFLLAGDRTAAALAYRRYASSVERELDAPRTLGLRALIE